MVWVEGSVCISEFSVNRLEETEFTSVVHFHCILARTVNKVFSCTSVGTISFVYRVQWYHSRTEADHHPRRLRARLYWVILGYDSRSITLILFRNLLIIGVLRIDLTRLSDADTFTLACYLHIWIYLASYDYVFLNELNRVVLTVWNLLRRVPSKLFGIKNFTAIATLPASFLSLSFAENLITVLRILVDLKLTNLYNRLVLTSIYPHSHAHVACTSRIRILRAYIDILLLAEWSLRYVHRILIALLFFIRIDAGLRNVDRAYDVFN